MNVWTTDMRTAEAVAETATMTREQLTARLVSLAAGLTEDDLRNVVVAAMLAPQRQLDRESLGEEQRAREATETL